MLVRVIKYFQVQGLKLMGKQINYYMEYDSFILLAKKAIELGCEIFPFSVIVFIFLKPVTLKQSSIGVKSA